MATQEDVGERAPLPLRVLGWLLILGGVASAIGILASGGAFSPARSGFHALSRISAAVAGWGFLGLRRWAIYLYFGGFLVNSTLFFGFPPSEEAYALYTRPAALALMGLVPGLVAALVARYRNRFS